MTASDFSPAAIQQERERVLGLLSGITQGNWERVGEDICTGYEYKDGKHSAEWIAELCDPADFGDALDDGWRAYSPTNDANAALICVAPDTARKYADALGEIERLHEALGQASAIVGQVERAQREPGVEGQRARWVFGPAAQVAEVIRAALASAPEERP